MSLIRQGWWTARPRAAVVRPPARLSLEVLEDRRVPTILTIREATGATPAAIQATVDAFRADLGANNGTGGTFTSGRREVSWDDVPDVAAAPNPLPVNFYNAPEGFPGAWSFPRRGPGSR